VGAKHLFGYLGTPYKANYTQKKPHKYFQKKDQKKKKKKKKKKKQGRTITICISDLINA